MAENHRFSVGRSRQNVRRNVWHKGVANRREITRWRGTIRRCGRLACRQLQLVVTVLDEYVSCAPAARAASHPASSHEDDLRCPWAASRPSRVTVAGSLRWRSRSG